MAAAIGFFASDGTTPLASVFYGLVPPGSSYSARNSAYKQIVVKNVGDVPLEQVLVSIIPFAVRDGSESVRIATGADPQPEDFQDINDGALDVGALEPDETANLWVDIVEAPNAQLAMGKGWTFEASAVPATES